MGQVSQRIEISADQGRQEEWKFVEQAEGSAEQACQDKKTEEAKKLESECDADAKDE